MMNDLSFAVRQLKRAPAFALVVVATLALGIGANTALFTVASGILLRPLPGVHDSQQLVWASATRGPGGRAINMSYPDFERLRDDTRDVFSGIAAVASARFSISDRGEPERVRGELVSAQYFEVLHARMAFGRAFVPADDSAGSPQLVAVIGYDLWQRRYAADSTIIGKRIIVNGVSLAIVGIAAERFNGADLELRRDVWLPITLTPLVQRENRAILGEPGSWWLTAIARLQPGVSRDRADAALANTARRIVLADSATHDVFSMRTFSAASGVPAGAMSEVTPIAVLAVGTTMLVLLIACANVSNLLLGRSVARRREVAVRLSLGASRRRLVRQFLTESSLLALLAAGAALLVAMWGSDLLAASTLFPVQVDLSIDAKVLAFSIGAALFTALVVGLLPALDATRPSVTGALKDASPGGDVRHTRLQHWFVVAQVSLSFVLLIASGVLLRALQRGNETSVGFDATTSVLAVSFDLGTQGYDDRRAAAFLDALNQRAAALPGVERVSFTDQVPLSSRHIATQVVLDGMRDSVEATRDQRQPLEVFQSSVRPGYFATIGISLLLGRDFTDADREGAPLVAVVSERFAAQAWPNENPIGKQISVSGTRGDFRTVVGVVREISMLAVTDRGGAAVYLPQRQHSEFKELTMMVRARGDAAQHTTSLRRILRDLDANLPIHDVRTLAQYRDDSMSKERTMSVLVGMFGALAMLLASIGVYAVMAFRVSQRTREIGVRLALGALQQQIVLFVVRQGLRITAVGLVAGLVLGAGVARLLAVMLPSASSTDLVPFVGVALLLGGVSTLASWVPARRAARVDPIQALRHD